MSAKLYANVSVTRNILISAGFVEILERESWAGTIQRGKKYFLTRNGSSIVAFGVGSKWKPGNGIAIVGAHTDSPTLRVKPASKKTAEGYQQVGVETYGGGLWHTWFDRDLSVAGRVFVKDESSSKYVPKLLKIDQPLLRIPSLAIHLDREVNTKFEFNKETQLFPIVGLIEEKLNQKEENSPEKASEEPDSSQFQSLGSIGSRHESQFLQLIASNIQASPDAIQDFELVLFDVQPSVLGGISEEFIFSPRLDNLNSSYTATKALIESVEDSNSLEDEESIRMVSLFDHEEIGSASAQGADSNLLLAVISRLASHKFSGAPSPTASSPYETFAKSFLVSADMAHAVHPNYASKHESTHKPRINKGPTVKVNANQRYATNSPGILLIQNAANIAKVPLQLFVTRNDSPCGSTIGPILASKLGVRTIDIGNPQLSMHSIRETGGTYDVEYSVKLLTSFFKNYTNLEREIFVDGEVKL